MHRELAHYYIQQLNPGKICTCETLTANLFLATLAQV